MALAKLPRGKIKSYNMGKIFSFFHFFHCMMPKKNSGPFRKKSFLFAYQNFQKKKEEKATKREKKSFIHVLSIFFQTQEIQVLEKSTSNEKKSYASMAIIWP